MMNLFQILRLWLGFGICVALAGCSSAPTQQRAIASESKAPFELTKECRSFIASLPEGFHYGWITNSESSELKSSLVHVFYYHRPVKGQVPAIFFNGGPRHSSHKAFGWVHYPITDAGISLWLVYTDQRGTGCSTPYPKNRADKGDYLNWSSTDIVRDSEKIRQALGFERWRLYGQSFGSAIVHRYIEMFPESITTAVAHGFAPLPKIGKLNQWRYEQQLFVIKKYLEEYPEDRIAIKTILEKNLCDENWWCGAYALNMWAREYMSYVLYWNELHEKIQSLAQSTVSQNWDSHRSKPVPSPKKENESWWDGYNQNIGFILNIEYAGADGGTEVNCNRVRTQAIRILGDLKFYPLSECYYRRNQAGQDLTKNETVQSAMKNRNLRPIDTALIRKNLERFPQIDFHLFSSEFDYATPRAIMSASAKAIGSRVNFYKIPGGHEQYLSRPVLAPLLAPSSQ